jgi:diaminohydroxyphosphoribosylaminopyrimidine deaminase/5-amino-6-(5-phosphoribosylamino)uracil reductase
VDLKKLLKALAKRGITNILVEGGGELIASLVKENLVDRFLVFIAPKIIGGRDAKTAVEGSGIENIKDALKLKNMSMKRFKEDILIEAQVQ